MTTTAPLDRVVTLPGGRRIFYDRLTPEERTDIDEKLAAFAALCERNPLQGFESHSSSQEQFIASRKKIVAAIAGNRFGKSTSLVVKALVECLPRQALPERLLCHRRFDGPVHGWIMCPTEEKVFDSLKPAFERWVGAEFFKGGAWGKAFNAERMMLSFVNPYLGGKHWSTIGFKTYKQDESTLGGASLWFVGYDEPPPRGHREEGRTRLVDHDGFEMFAFTPIATNVAFVKKAIFKRREDPEITLVRGSIHDNSTLPKAAIKAWLDGFADGDALRAAREFGDFVDVGGLIYENFERTIIEPWIPGDEPAIKAGRFSDVVVGIDPGVRNCGIVFGDVDSHNVITIFDELLIQNGTVEDYAKRIKAKLEHWGVPLSRVDFRIDPKSAAARTMVDKQTVQTALAILGIGCTPADNAVEAGIQQVRGRIQHKRLWVTRSCAHLRDEADEYAAEDREDGDFKVVKTNDHLLDAARYLAQARPFYPAFELAAPSRNLGAQRFVANVAPPASSFITPQQSPPLGAMS